MDTDESGLPLRFFLHASPTATLRPTRSGLVSRERPIPAGLAPEVRRQKSGFLPPR